MKKIIFMCLLFAFFLPGLCAAAQPDGQLTFTLKPTVKKDSKKVDLWVPYPMSDDFQTISNMSVTGNYETRAIYRDPGSEAIYLHVTWNHPKAQPECIMQFHISQKDRRNEAIKESGSTGRR